MVQILQNQLRLVACHTIIYDGFLAPSQVGIFSQDFCWPTVVIQAPGAPELFRLHQADDGEVLLEFFWLGWKPKPVDGNMVLKEHKQKDFLSTGKVDSWSLLNIAKCFWTQKDFLSTGKVDSWSLLNIAKCFWTLFKFIRIYAVVRCELVV